MPAVINEIREVPEASSFSIETREWIEQADPADRKSLGQYMTPRFLRDALIDRLDLFAGTRVLDPGVGTGEFLKAVSEREPSARLTGWDVDPGILRFAARNLPGADLKLRSALDPQEPRSFDLVIGNPPYFQFRATAAIKRRFSRVISGRPNIFALFFQAAAGVVRPGGQIAFVVPPSMNNGAYFEGLRRFILEHGSIEHLEILDRNDHFDRANTAVQLIVIRAGERNGDFHLTRRCPDTGFTRTIFTPEPGRLEKEFTGRSTLWQLGFRAVTGTVVWNRHRDRLARRPGSETVPLIWAHNVGRGELLLDETRRRPQHIRGIEPLCGPALVVNRVVGRVGRGELRAAPVPDGMKFIAENHVNVIRPRAGAEPEVTWPELLAAMSSPAVPGRIRLLTGNTQISATELNHLLPMDHP